MKPTSSLPTTPAADPPRPASAALADRPLPVEPPQGWRPDDSDWPTDDQLAARALRSPEAFGVLYQRHQGAVLSYVHVRLGCRETAEDVTSQVFAKALVGLPSFRGGTFRGWLFTIAHHTMIDELRRQRPAAPLAATVPDPSPSPEWQAFAAERRRVLAGALERLPPDQRQIVELRLAGLSGAEVAWVTGRSPGAVAVAQHRAVRRLRLLLADQVDLLEPS